jgi:hypothetical protein
MSESNLFQNTDPKPTSSLFEMNLDAQNSYNLRSSASWAKVLGIVGIITGAILIIMMGITLSRIENVGRFSRYDRSAIEEVFAAKTGLWITILAGIIFIIGGVFSFNFGNKMNTALKANDQDGLNAGFAALRNYFALRSITLIIVLLLFLIGLANMV